MIESLNDITIRKENYLNRGRIGIYWEWGSKNITVKNKFTTNLRN